MSEAYKYPEEEFFEAFDTIITLPTEQTVEDVAEACRTAALSFINESGPWGKAELALWLMGPYAQLAHSESYRDREPAGFPSGGLLLRDIDARFVDRFTMTARDEVLRTVRSLHDPRQAEAFIWRMLETSFIAPCEDHLGANGWIPTPRAIRLADRVLSLVATDYLVRPADYSYLDTCSRCDSLTFGGPTGSPCGRHGSGIQGPNGFWLRVD
jgi:hypothetical protein